MDYGEQIHDGVRIRGSASPWVRRDIEALRDVWLTGQRANWRITILPRTIAEVQATRDLERLHALMNWTSELWAYSEECALSSEAHEETVHYRTMATLSILPDMADRQLVKEAVVSGCDAFCTRDWNTILRHRDSLTDVPLSFISPHEWRQTIVPYAALFI